MKLVNSLIAAAFVFSMATAQAVVIIGGTRIIYHADKKESSLDVKNPDPYSYLIQSWVDKDENDTSKTPFIVTPPLFRLAGNEENKLRIINTGGNLPQDRESLFWMNIKTIPATEKLDNVNTLQIAIKTRIKLIYRPASLTEMPEKFASKLSWKRSDQQLTVSNPTPYYMNFSEVKVGASTVTDATYVAPMSSATFSLPANAKGNIRWKIISDFGAAGAEHQTQ